MTDTTDHPSRRAGLRDELVKALGRIKTCPPVAHCREQADHVLAVLYREWPWLRAEAEDAAAVSVPAADRAALSARIAAAVQPLLMDTLPKPIAAVRADEVADAVLAVLPASADRAAVLREAVRRIEDGEPLPDRDLRFRRGADWVLDALRRLAAETAVPVVGVAADTTPAAERPRCTYCGLPHDLTPSMALACASIRAMVDTVAPAEPGPVVPAQPGNDTPVVAYRSHSGSLLRCLTHTPDQTALDNGTFHPVTADDLPDGGICTYRAPGVECGVDVLTPQQPKEA